MSETLRLLEAARTGNREALNDLLARHRGRLLAFLRSEMSIALSRRLSADDVLQETLLEAARKIDAFEPRGPHGFYRWLVAIARFKVAEAERAQRALKRSREEALEEEPPGAGTSPSGRAARSERGERIREAIAALPEDQARAIRLRYLEGSTVAETAAKMGRSEPAVKALVTRGFEGLGRALGGAS